MTTRAAVIDARLVLPAAAAWAAAAATCATEAGVASWLVAVAVAVLAAATRWRRFALAAAAVGCALGATSAWVHVDAARSGPVAAAARAHRTEDLAVTLVRDPQPGVSARGTSYVLADATVTAIGPSATHAAVLVIGHGGQWAGLLPGQRLQLRARLQPPRRGDGISAVAIAAGPVARIGAPPWWQRLAGVIRSGLRRASAPLPDDERGLVPALVDGDVSAMPPSLTSAFRTSGLTHLNAVSGENCAVVLATVGALVRRLPLSRGLRHVVVALGLLAFVVVARPSPSVLRAAVMGGIAVAAGAVGRRARPVPLLAAAVFALVLADPFLALSPGFALSVLATAAIVVGARPLADRLSRLMPPWLAMAVAVPVVAQAACTPVLVLVFGQLTPWAVLANVLAAPAVAPATIAGVSAAVAALVMPAVAQLAAAVAAIPAWWLALVARAVARLPGAHAGGGGLTLLAAAVVVGLLASRRRTSLLRAILRT